MNEQVYHIPIIHYHLRGSDVSDCCCSSRSNTTNPVRHRCPINGMEYAEVPGRTVSHHIEDSWLWDDKGQPYYFCDDPDCDVVYFGLDNSLILKSRVRTIVGLKERSEDAPVCYCYGATKADAKNKPVVRDFIIRKTKAGECSCETSNPSGSCCLKYFPDREQ